MQVFCTSNSIPYSLFSVKCTTAFCNNPYSVTSPPTASPIAVAASAICESANGSPASPATRIITDDKDRITPLTVVASCIGSVDDDNAPKRFFMLLVSYRYEVSNLHAPL